MEIVDNIYQVFSEVGSTYLEAFLRHLPHASIALFTIIIGYFLAWIASIVVKKVLYHLNLDQKLRKADLDDSFGKISLAKLFGDADKMVRIFRFFHSGNPCSRHRTN